MSAGQTLFIGSFSEGQGLATAVAARLRQHYEDVTLRCWWHKDVFLQDKTFIENLERDSRTCTAALFLFTPDDAAEVHGKPEKIPRDNVLFEYGLFSGLHGRERVALVQVDKARLPTDLLGVAVAREGDHPFSRSSDHPDLRT